LRLELRLESKTWVLASNIKLAHSEISQSHSDYFTLNMSHSSGSRVITRGWLLYIKHEPQFWLTCRH
jgi:hypothetical protein